MWSTKVSYSTMCSISCIKLLSVDKRYLKTILVYYEYTQQILVDRVKKNNLTTSGYEEISKVQKLFY